MTNQLMSELEIGDFEIGRILHLKSEIRNLKLNGSWLEPQSNLRFRISDLRCRIRPSKFPGLRLPAQILIFSRSISSCAAFVILGSFFTSSRRMLVGRLAMLMRSILS